MSAKEELFNEEQTRQEKVSAKERFSDEGQTHQEIVSAKIPNRENLQTTPEICRPPLRFADHPGDASAIPPKPKKVQTGLLTLSALGSHLSLLQTSFLVLVSKQQAFDFFY